MNVPLTRQTVPLVVVFLATVTSMGMAIGGNSALKADSLQQAQLNETEREGLLGEHGRLEEFPNETREVNTTAPEPPWEKYFNVSLGRGAPGGGEELSRRIKMRLVKPSLQYTIWVADTFAWFVYTSSLPTPVYSLLAHIPIVAGLGLYVHRIVQLLRRLKE